MGLDVASIAMMVAGTALNAVGKVVEGNAQAKNYQYEAQVAQNNATIARQNAEYAVRAGETQAATQGIKNRAALGAMVAQTGANNIDVNTGSPLLAQESQREVGLQDVLQIRSNARLTAYGYQTQATNYQAQSQLEQQEASQAQRAGWFGGLTSLLGGGVSDISEWQKYQLSNPGSNSLDTSLLQPGGDINASGGLVGGGYASGYY